jgi:hypothetical protein
LGHDCTAAYPGDGHDDHDENHGDP